MTVTYNQTVYRFKFAQKLLKKMKKKQCLQCILEVFVRKNVLFLAFSSVH